MMTSKFDSFNSIPIGAMFAIADDRKWEKQLNVIGGLPESLHPVVGDPKVGAYMRGLVAANDLPVEKSAPVAQVVLEVVTGLLAAGEMAGALAQRCGCSTEVAGNMAREIEKELLAPVALELNAYWQEVSKRRDGGDSSPRQGVVQNDTVGAGNRNSATGKNERGGSFTPPGGSAQDDTGSKGISTVDDLAV